MPWPARRSPTWRSARPATRQRRCTTSNGRSAVERNPAPLRGTRPPAAPSGPPCGTPIGPQIGPRSVGTRERDELPRLPDAELHRAFIPHVLREAPAVPDVVDIDSNRIRGGLKLRRVRFRISGESPHHALRQAARIVAVHANRQAHDLHGRGSYVAALPNVPANDRRTPHVRRE